MQPMEQALPFSYANGDRTAWLTCHGSAGKVASDKEGEGSLSLVSATDACDHELHQHFDSAVHCQREAS